MTLPIPENGFKSSLEPSIIHGKTSSSSSKSLRSTSVLLPEGALSVGVELEPFDEPAGESAAVEAAKLSNAGRCSDPSTRAAEESRTMTSGTTFIVRSSLNSSVIKSLCPSEKTESLCPSKKMESARPSNEDSLGGSVLFVEVVEVEEALSE